MDKILLDNPFAHPKDDGLTWEIYSRNVLIGQNSFQGYYSVIGQKPVTFLLVAV